MIPLTFSPRQQRRRRGGVVAPAVAVAAALAVAAVVAPGRAGAQILQVPTQSREPLLWGGVGIGFHQMAAVLDGRTGTGWRFGSGAQYRGTLEYAVGRAYSVGVSGSYARMPLRYVSLTNSPLPNGSFATDAHVEITQLMATFHAGGATGFHYILDAGVGVTHFANFEADDSGTALPPRADTDFAFSAGTGFGYSTSPSTEFFVVQDYGNIIHQRDGLPGDARTNVQQLTTRVGVRYGVGARSR